MTTSTMTPPAAPPGALENAAQAASTTLPPGTPAPTVPSSPTVPPAPTAKPPASAGLEDIGVTEEQLSALIERGLVSKPAESLDDLSPEVKKLVEDRLRERSQEVERAANERLYASINKLKEDNKSIQDILAETAEKTRKEEEARQQQLEEERLKKASTEEKLQILQNSYREELSKVSDSAQSKISELEKQLRVAQLTGLRKELIADAGGKIIPELVPDPASTDVDADTLTAAARKAQEMYVSLETTLREKILAEVSQDTPPAPPPSPGHGRGVGIPDGTAHLAPHESPLDLSNVKNASRKELEVLKAKALARFGMA